MNEARPVFSILVLSEDSAGNSLASIRAVSKSILRLIDPSSRLRRVDFEPEGEDAQRAMHANLAKGRKDAAGHEKLVTISRTIATTLMSGGFVFFHLDADRRWSAKEPSENLTSYYRDRVLVRVEQHVAGLLAKKAEASSTAAVLSRLCLISPYYSVESWLYQNTVAAKTLCQTHYRGLHAERFESWEKNRAALDELDKPKAQTCLGSKHNHELATDNFPSQAVYDVGKSFAQTVDRMRSCEALVAALAATRATY